MPKNRGGKKFKRQKKNPIERKMIYKDTVEEGQLYGLVIEVLGDCRYKVKCEDNIVRRGNLRGKLRKRCRPELNDIVIICPRDFQDSKGDIIHIYDSSEKNILLNSCCEKLNPNKINNNNLNEDYEDNVIFKISNSDDDKDNEDLNNL